MLLFSFIPISFAQTIYKSEYGSCFTPKKDLKVLVVCVSFTNYAVDSASTEWPADSLLPNYAKNDRYIFDNLSDFDNIDSNNMSVSHYYYEKTKHLSEEERFKLYGEFLPVQITLPSALPANPNNGDWNSINRIVFDSLKSQFSNDYSYLASFDNRGYTPNYRYDQSLNNAPDDTIDFLAIIYR